MTKEYAKKTTFNLYLAELIKQIMPTRGYKLIKEKRTWYGLIILTFEKTIANG